ncbi:MAG: hypothetical protein ABI675_02930 [Chitinophagaceae bacterium]
MKCKNFLISVVITVVFGCIVLLLGYASGSPLGNFFDVFIVLIVTRWLVIAFGIIVLLLRLLKILSDNSSLVYILAGTVNMFLAVVGITLFITDQADMEWLHQSIGNLLVGFLILTDTFMLRAVVKH